MASIAEESKGGGVGGRARGPGRRVALVVNSLRCGGAERAVSSLANHLVRRGHASTVITVDGADSDFYTLEPGVGRVALGMLGRSSSPFDALRANRARWVALREALASSRAELAVAFIREAGVLLAAAVGRKGIPFVVSERIDPRLFPPRPVWRPLVRAAYARAARLVPNSASVESWMAERHGREKVAAIPNMVERAPATGAGDEVELPQGPFVLAVGRLEHQKGHDDLLRAMAQSRPFGERGEWGVVIAGEGSMRDELARLARELGLAERVHLVGRVRDPFALYERASIFAFPSRFEGFPNALLEAMSAGLAPVSYDSGSGSSELITHGETGLLVPLGDVDGLRAALDRLVSDEELRARLGEAAREVTEAYSPAAVVPLWERLFEDVLQERGG